MSVPSGMRECVICVMEPQIDVMQQRLTNISLAPAVFYLELMRSCRPQSLIKPDKSGEKYRAHSGTQPGERTAAEL